MAKHPKDQKVQTAVEAPTLVRVTPPTVHTKKLEVLGEIKPESAITWNITTNPRSRGRATYDRFARYFSATTVGEYTAKGGTRGDLLWDLRSGFLSIEGVELGGEVASRKTLERKSAAEKEPKAPREKKVKEPKAPVAADAGMVEELAD